MLIEAERERRAAGIGAGDELVKRFEDHIGVLLAERGDDVGRQTLVADHVDLIDVHAEGVAARFRCGAEHTDTGAACDLPHDVAAVIVKLHCAGVASLLIAEAVAVDDRCLNTIVDAGLAEAADKVIQIGNVHADHCADLLVSIGERHVADRDLRSKVTGKVAHVVGLVVHAINVGQFIAERILIVKIKEFLVRVVRCGFYERVGALAAACDDQVILFPGAGLLKEGGIVCHCFFAFAHGDDFSRNMIVLRFDQVQTGSSTVKVGFVADLRNEQKNIVAVAFGLCGRFRRCFGGSFGLRRLRRGGRGSGV